MKKLILCLLLSSCGYGAINNASPIIIIAIESSVTPPYCLYSGKDFCFKDTCGKFQIGDTVNLIKK